LAEKYMIRKVIRTSKENLILAGASVAGVLLLSMGGTLSLSNAQFEIQELEPQQQLEERQQPQQQANITAQNGTRIVEAGGGGPVSVVTWFNPQNVSISAGQTVTWINPTVVSEPHTVSFMKDPSYFANFESPYLIPNGTELTPANPEEKNTEPLIISGQNETATNTIIAANKRQASPAVIDAQNSVTYLQPNANYTMNGDELYVNSGIIWPQDSIPPGAPPITSFSVTFETAGTYDYICAFHPWMTGRVIVQ
jgi:plastocyanin